MNSFARTTFAFQDQVPVISESSKIGQILAFANPNGQSVRVMPWSTAWNNTLQNRFDEITSLPIGWDGYNGRPVSFTCASFAAKLLEGLYVEGLSAPDLVPGSDGTLQIEWHKNKFDIEIDVLGANKVQAMRSDHITKLETQLELDVDFSILKQWIIALSNPHA